MQAIFGTMVAPGLLDRLLARRGYSGQMTAEPEQPGRPDNLMAPLPGNHGRFDARARGRVGAVDPAWLRGAAGLALGLLLLLAASGRTRPRLPRRW